MQHFTVAVIIKTNPSYISKFEDDLSKERKIYFSEENIKFAEELLESGLSDSTNLLQALKEYNGGEVGEDEKGIYNISTTAFKDRTISFLAEKIEKPFSRFDFEQEIKEYKYYLSKEEVKEIAVHYGIDISDTKAIAEKINDWNSDKGGFDEGGIYALSTINREGKFDGWEAFDVMTVRYFLNNLDKLDEFPESIFTHECNWIDLPEYFMKVDKSGTKHPVYFDWENKWKNNVKEVLECYLEDGIVLLVNCHQQ